MTTRAARAELAALERIIVDGVTGMDPEDALASVLVHYADGSRRRLLDVIEEAAGLRRWLTERP